MKRAVREAIARIEVTAAGEVVSRGTGTLVSDRLVLTALHVVADRRSQPPQPIDGAIKLTFPGFEASARIADDAFDGAFDWALLECDEAPPAQPVSMATLDRSGVRWETFGFPDANPRDGMLQSGTVENHDAELEGVHALQLFGRQAAAGTGAPVRGLSGAPVLVDDQLVGVLRFALMQESRTVAGTLYGCPVSALAEPCGDLLEIGEWQPPKTETQSKSVVSWLVAAVLLALVVGGALWLARGDRDGSAEAVSVRASAAVLGFANLSGNESDAWLSTALSEVLGSSLAAGDQLRLVPAENTAGLDQLRESTSGEQEDADWGRLRSLLASDHFISGTYSVLGDEDAAVLRVDVRLRDAEGEVLFGEGATGSPEQLFDLLERVGAGIRATLGVGELQPADALAVMASVPQTRAAREAYALGLAALRRYEVPYARQLFERAIDAEDEHPLPHAALARAQLYLGQWEDAAAAAERALDRAGDLLDIEQSLIEATLHKARGDYDQAATVYRMRFDRYPDDLYVGLLLAGAQINAGQARQALATLDALERLPPPLSEHPSLLRERALALVDLGELPAARDAAVAGIERANEQGAVHLGALLRQTLAATYLQADEVERSVELLKQARQVFEAEGDLVGVAQVEELQAHAELSRGDLDGALLAFEALVETYRELTDVLGEAAARHSRAEVLSRKGEFHESDLELSRAIELYRGANDKNGEAAALNDMGVVLHLHGQLDQASRMYSQALTLFAEIGRDDARAVILRNLGEIAYLGCDLERSRDFHEEALAIDRDAQMRGNEGFNLQRLGLVAAAAGDLDESRRLLQSSVDIFDEIGAVNGADESRFRLAELDLSEGKVAEAEAQATQAQTSLAESGAVDLVLLAESVVVRAALAQDAEGSREAASAFLQRAEASSDQRVLFRAAVIDGLGRLLDAADDSVRSAVLNDLAVTAESAEELGYTLASTEMRGVIESLRATAVSDTGSAVQRIAGQAVVLCGPSP